MYLFCKWSLISEFSFWFKKNLHKRLKNSTKRGFFIIIKLPNIGFFDKKSLFFRDKFPENPATAFNSFSHEWQQGYVMLSATFSGLGNFPEKFLQKCF